MRMKVDRKIASSETTSVSILNGGGSNRKCLGPMKFSTSQDPNHKQCTYTNCGLPQNPAMASETMSALVRLECAAYSIRVMASTFLWMTSSKLLPLVFG